MNIPAETLEILDEKLHGAIVNLQESSKESDGDVELHGHYIVIHTPRFNEAMGNLKFACERLRRLLDK